MGVVEGLWLGILQGLTEFLPISSSGHLVILQSLFGIKEPQVLFDAGLHLGTLMALLIYFRRDLMDMALDTISYFKIRTQQMDNRYPENRKGIKLLISIILAQIPTGVIGLLIEKPVESIFSSTSGVGIMLLITAFILILSGFIPESHLKRDTISPLFALFIGAIQGMAVIPGISRSGITIVFAMTLGIERGLCARFSFLISIPAIIGAVALKILHEGIHGINPYSIIAGITMSFIVGLLALYFMIRIVKKGKLILFSPYCILIGLISIFIL